MKLKTYNLLVAKAKRKFEKKVKFNETYGKLIRKAFKVTMNFCYLGKPREF